MRGCVRQLGLGPDGPSKREAFLCQAPANRVLVLSI